MSSLRRYLDGGGREDRGKGRRRWSAEFLAFFRTNFDEGPQAIPAGCRDLHRGKSSAGRDATLEGNLRDCGVKCQVTQERWMLRWQEAANSRYRRDRDAPLLNGQSRGRSIYR